MPDKRKNNTVIKRVCIRTTAIRYLLRNADGLIFRPIENSNNSTPISAGSSRSPISSDIPIIVKK